MTDSARMLVALDAAAHDPGALDILAQTALALDAELAALIVQDMDLLRLARLPFAHELGASTAIARPLDAEQLGVALRARALRAQQGLTNRLQAWDARLSLRFAEGKIVPQALAAAEGSDFVLFGAARQRWRTPARARSRQWSIMLLLEDAPLPVPALRAAVRLQRALQVPLSVVVAGTEQAFFRVRTEASARLGSTSARFRRVASGECLAVAQAALREGAQLIVLPPESRLAGQDSLGIVLAESCCAVLWVR